jgi:phospholipid-binding lipoprotein MlaA
MKTAFFKVSALSLLLAVASVQAQEPAASPDTFGADTAPAAQIADPWEGFNRSVFNFNLKADRYLVKPFAKAYVKITPVFLRRGVNNVFSNVMEVPSALNGLLQGNFSGAAQDTGRLLVNTTLGLGGLLDVAQHMGLKSREGEDFGQTLAVWGVESGPYLVLPFLGPSTLRDSLATPVDWYTDPKTYIDHVPTRNTVRGLSLLNTRANLFPVEKSITGDKYTFMRDAYLQNRDFLIKNGEVEDSFGSDASLGADSGY